MLSPDVARIVLNTFGSLGDLHPFLAIAIELRNRGHEAVVATAEVYRDKVVAEGIGFAPVRPDLGQMLDNTELLAQVWDARSGTESLLRKVIFPSVEASFEDLSAASRDADLLITHSAGYAGPIAAEFLKKRWLSVVLQPMVFFSTFDPPAFGQAPWLKHFYRLGRWSPRLVHQIAKRQVRRWSKPIHDLRRRLGLRRMKNPVFEGQFSSDGTLALFSRHFANPQPDWPRRVTVTGFVFYDRLGIGLVSNSVSNGQALTEFLAGGPPPVVFTLGSSAVMHPGSFFAESLGAAEQLGVRAVLLAGRFAPPPRLPPSIFVTDYVPYGQLLPRAAVTVHQGGIGTTAQALLAGKPMLVVPWAHDQPDNAERVRKLGVGSTLNRARYTGARAAAAIRQLLDQTHYAESAARLRNCLVEENGRAAACDRIEAVINAPAARPNID